VLIIYIKIQYQNDNNKLSYLFVINLFKSQFLHNIF